MKLRGSAFYSYAITLKALEPSMFLLFRLESTAQGWSAFILTHEFPWGGNEVTRNSLGERTEFVYACVLDRVFLAIRYIISITAVGWVTVLRVTSLVLAKVRDRRGFVSMNSERRAEHVVFLAPRSANTVRPISRKQMERLCSIVMETQLGCHRQSEIRIFSFCRTTNSTLFRRRKNTTWGDWQWRDCRA